jgi:hypothetical protein
LRNGKYKKEGVRRPLETGSGECVRPGYSGSLHPYHINLLFFSEILSFVKTALCFIRNTGKELKLTVGVGRRYEGVDWSILKQHFI